MKPGQSEPVPVSFPLWARTAGSGTFLSLDGIDGCGKSTQCRLLADWLRGRGYKVTTCRDPGGTALGDQLRTLLLDSATPRTPEAETLLFMASRAQLVAEVIRPALDRGEVVVSDRYLLSTVAYQGHGKGLDPFAIWQVGGFGCHGFRPDLTLVLDLPVEVAFARLNRPSDRMESLGEEFFEKVRQGFLDEARIFRDHIRVIDANQPGEVVHAQIIKEVSRVLGTDSGT